MEYFDVLNEYGEFTGKTATREECHKKGLWHKIVVIAIIDKNKNILNIMRFSCIVIQRGDERRGVKGNRKGKGCMIVKQGLAWYI